MNYWQFKSRNLDTSFKELKELKDGDIFFTEITENHILRKVGVDTIIFWDRTDKEKGIYLVTKIVSEPYETDELSSSKAIPMKVIKKLDRPFILENNGFKKLHEHLNTTIHKGRVRSRVDIGNIENIAPDTGERLYKKLLNEQDEVNTNLIEIKKNEIIETLDLFKKQYDQYELNGKEGHFYNIFAEANISGQEIRHSSYLANLLDTNGKHFQGNLFLKNFIEELKLYDTLQNSKAIHNFDYNNCTVATEEHNETAEAKGLMDIVLKDGKHAIIIENKTGTKDHNGQLVKYKDFIENVEDYKDLEDYIILYLTPHGEVPTDIKAQNDPNIVPISYIDDVKNCMQNSLENISNKKLKDIITQYIDAIQLYAFDLPVDWNYNVSALELITKEKTIFDNCKLITQLVNYNTIEEYKSFNNKEITMAKWIARNFVKSKSKLELLFMNNLSLELDEILSSKNYKFSHYSNIFTNTSEMSQSIDINLIYKARKNRIKSYNDTKDEEYKSSMRDKSQTLLVHEKTINANESYRILISNDRFGLRAFYYHIKNEEIINNFNESAVDLLEVNEFYSPKIDAFLNESYLNDKINKSIDKILDGLKVLDT